MILIKPPAICGRCKKLFSRDVIQDHIRTCKNSKKKPKNIEKAKKTSQAREESRFGNFIDCPVCHEQIARKKYLGHLQLAHRIYNPAILAAKTKKERLAALLNPDDKKPVVDIFDAGRTVSGGGIGVAGKKR